MKVFRYLVVLLLVWFSGSVFAAIECMGDYVGQSAATTACQSVRVSPWTNCGATYHQDYVAAWCGQPGVVYISYSGSYKVWNYVASCPAGKVADPSGACVDVVVACQYDANLTADDPACVAPPTCTAGPVGEYATQVTNGITVDSYCDGSCTFNLEWSNESTSCWTYEGQVGQFCSYVKVLTGTSCAPAEGPVLDVAVPTPETAQQVPTCPTGYMLNANGICEMPAIAGTASTSTAGGTAGTPGATACPVGYSDIGGGVCASTSASPTATVDPALGCPAGYVRNAEGYCTATATLDNGAGESATQAEKSAADAMSTGLVGSVASAPTHGWTWAWTLPSGSCVPWVFDSTGMHTSIDPCPTFDKLKAFLSYVFYILTAFSIFNIMFSNRAPG